jgi:3-oxoadipate enol-lactonase
VEAFRDAYRCVTWDERCWGQTETSDAPFTYWDLADDCLGLMDHLGVQRAVLVGMSQGGFLSMRAALRAPERVRALVLVDTDPFALEEQIKALYGQLQTQGEADGMSPELAATLAGFLFAPGYDATYWQGKWRARPMRTDRQALHCLLERDDISERLREITCPTLVIHGELDAAFPVGTVDAWANRIPNVQPLLRVPGAGHSANLEQPGVVNPPLRSFLNGLA